jgi:hypothetical protein
MWKSLWDTQDKFSTFNRFFFHTQQLYIKLFTIWIRATQHIRRFETTLKMRHIHLEKKTFYNTYSILEKNC